MPFYELSYQLIYKYDVPQRSKSHRNMDTSIQLLDDKILHREYGNLDWTQSLCAAPDCIGILGQCLLISFRPDLLGVKLEADGLR